MPLVQVAGISCGLAHTPAKFECMRTTLPCSELSRILKGVVTSKHRRPQTATANTFTVRHASSHLRPCCRVVPSQTMLPTFQQPCPKKTCWWKWIVCKTTQEATSRSFFVAGPASLQHQSNPLITKPGVGNPAANNCCIQRAVLYRGIHVEGRSKKST